MWRSVITGTGSYIPTEVKTNQDFTSHDFYTEQNVPIGVCPNVVVEKFQKITGIAERRYVASHLTTSDIATLAAEEAIRDSGIDPETLDMIIVAHNFGNVIEGTIQSDAVPALASRVKHNLKIKSPNCVAYDILFGCPGWVQGVIQADAFFKAGMARKALVIGAETLSRVIDLYDRDSMIFSDGAGASVVEYREVPEEGSGILASCARSHSVEEAYYINMNKSYMPDGDPRVRYIKMKGRKVYEYAIKLVPEAMKECLDMCGVDIKDVKKVFIHQANEKMDEGMIQALFKLYGRRDIPEDIMPMSIHYLGNSSVATVPTLYDIVRRGQDEKHELNDGDIILFASVGAGMNINAICYRV
ncbi:3-oxoacyl-ACP synthase III family protein [Pontibacter sp. BAB1700]|uniref:3-oxoacyl-ACP synthase III family protein n=1 Tax=Pontibacter sp. BAB1700 TaxID=1144253 RepID=UPI00026BDD55|nr:ketoacyl-ACP synthase III [Pontibacter sp. BAB1700]EJF10451.1 3-oxoacyl-ACP synthase [Pontibacter sp. BAB1700]